MKKKTSLRILHAVGPGDVVDSFQYWKSGEMLASETSLTYSGQYFSFCKRNQINTWVISSNPREALVNDGIFTVENRPKPGGASPSGLAFHFRELAYGLSIIRSAIRYRADIALIDSGTSHWFIFALLRLFGIKAVSNFHNAPWPAGFPPRKKLTRMILWLNGFYLKWGSNAAMGVSAVCQRQAEELAGAPIPFFHYRAMYLAEHFMSWEAPDFFSRPFRIAFAGRVERNKGVFDIVAMAAKLKKSHPGQVMFEICGDGAAMNDIRREVRASGLEDSVVLHGKLKRPALLDVYSRCQLVIVPTTSEFNEAFAMVAAEAVLMGRPVLSSPVVPACEVVAAAAVVARTDDVDDYVAKIIDLLADSQRYMEMCAACVELRKIFLDPSNGMEAALIRTVESIYPGWKGTWPGAEVGY